LFRPNTGRDVEALSFLFPLLTLNQAVASANWMEFLYRACNFLGKKLRKKEKDRLYYWLDHQAPIPPPNGLYCKGYILRLRL